MTSLQGEREELLAVGYNAPLPERYCWGRDALECFDVGRRAATNALLAAGYTKQHAALLAQAREALEIFAKCAQKYSEAEGGHEDVLSINSGWIDAGHLTMGDFRRAKAALAALTAATGGGE